MLLKQQFLVSSFCVLEFRNERQNLLKYFSNFYPNIVKTVRGLLFPLWSENNSNLEQVFLGDKRDSMLIRSCIIGYHIDGKKQWKKKRCDTVGANSARSCDDGFVVLSQWCSLCSGSDSTEGQLARAMDESVQRLWCLLSPRHCSIGPLHHWIHGLSLARAPFCS